ncbi:hypothetical protein AK812_SmicGene4674 [Symbiodinium microadriaticum]|uniref:Uncharacterized protein n=1 Tax=Symbiodinium microadriaticum TaxID=2951 RepID=A0A1Q9EVK3_SYMMI|nr:hypothetical protein AK812_SmicGene4674 [Symbiodinium microadriaticum]
MLVLAFGCMCLWALSGRAFVGGPAAQTRQVSVSAAAQVAYETDMPAENGVYPVGNAKRTAPYGERDPLPEGYGIRTGLSDLLKPLNAEAGVVAKEDSIPTVLVMVTGIVLLFLFYLLLLLLDNQSVLLPPEDEFDEYIMARGMLVLAFGCMCLWALSGRAFVGGPAAQTRQVSVSAAAQVAYETDMPAENGVYPVGNAKRTAPYGERDPLPEGYGIRTGLSDLLKPLNAEAGVVAKEDSIPTVLVMVTGIVLLFLFYLLLLLLDNQSVLLPPEDEFDEYIMARGMLVLAFGCMCLWALSGRAFVGGPAAQTRQVSVSAAAQVAYETDMPAENGVYPVGNAKRTAPYGERDPLPEGYGIRTGLSDLLKPLNAEAGVVAKEDSIPTVLVMVTGIVLLFLFYLLLLLLDNQSVLLPPEDEFDEYVQNFLPYFFFGEK